MKLEKSTTKPTVDKLSWLNGRPMSSTDWHNSQGEPSADILVTQLIGEQAKATPNALALQSATQSLSYQQLESRANQVAQRLRSLNTHAESLVGIWLPRSPDMVVAALAAMKVGAAYVPIDTEYPLQRVLFMLRDTKLRVLVTHREIARALPAGDWQLLILNDEAVEDVDQSRSSTFPDVCARDLAYVIYTSGSTGQPKAAQITHGGLLNLIHWHRRAFAVTAADRASQVTSFGFDAAGWEVWPYLTAGASVHFADDTTRLSPKSLRDWMLSEKISIGFAPTALAESLIALDWPPQTCLRLLLTGADMLRRYPPANLPFVLINNYGPTECTVVATSGQVPPYQGSDHLPTIGRPIDNVQTYILDDYLAPVPVGTIGQLYIGGAGLARGYLNRPEQETAAFVPNPFSNLSGDRLYRTGDLARYLPDGEIGFVGRTDGQVKIRGYRIEPNEIVMVLNRFPGVQTSVVVAQADNRGDKRLIAYLVSSNAQLTCGALQEHLRAQLPDYMVPVAFVRMDSLPLNASGKCDRSALPAPTSQNMIADEIYLPPRTAVEKQMVSILAGLLGLEKIGLNDNFFYLGGHSLLGTQLIARVRNAFGVELSLRKVFDSPTAAELSHEIERLLSSQHEIPAD